MSEARVAEYRATVDDLANESEIQRYLEERWNCVLHPLPHLYHVDFFAERDNQLVAWVEVKRRSNASTTYPTVFLNRDKKFIHLKGLSFAQPAFFVVRWADGVTRFIEVNKVRDEWLGFGGERDRWGVGRDDFEAVFEIPVDEMEVV